MRQGMGTGTPMRIAAPAWPYDGLDLSGKTTVGINIVAANNHIVPISATGDRGIEVNLGPVLYRSGGTRCQFCFMDRWRRWRRDRIRAGLHPRRHRVSFRLFGS
jgi:hypothetical protein